MKAVVVWALSTASRLRAPPWREGLLCVVSFWLVSLSRSLKSIFDSLGLVGGIWACYDVGFCTGTGVGFCTRTGVAVFGG